MLHLDSELVLDVLALLQRLERIGHGLDVLLDRGSDVRSPVSWMTQETTRVRLALEDALAAAARPAPGLQQ